MASFLHHWGVSPGEFERPVFELKLKGSLCRVERDNGLPLLDCYLPKGTTFVVRDRFNQKERSGVLSWGQFHLRQQKETFLMFRSEDGRFKRTRESLKLFFSGQNTKREIARVDSIYDAHYCRFH